MYFTILYVSSLGICCCYSEFQILAPLNNNRADAEVQVSRMGGKDHSEKEKEKEEKWDRWWELCQTNKVSSSNWGPVAPYPIYPTLINGDVNTGFLFLPPNNVRVVVEHRRWTNYQRTDRDTSSQHRRWRWGKEWPARVNKKELYFMRYVLRTLNWTERNSEKYDMMGGLVWKPVTAVPVVPAADLFGTRDGISPKKNSNLFGTNISDCSWQNPNMWRQ